MARGYDGGWPAYVPVAERRKKAARHVKRMREAGHVLAPVAIEGRTIARTLWGRAWCDNLESYRDYESRLPRGRSYLRNGLVMDLQIAALEIKAMVSGSSVYDVIITIETLPPATWRSICQDCAGGVDSLVDLLQGRFSKGVMERLCRQDRGLFPRPSEIRFGCSCPDGASMCKHIAAALYGVGARLDESPELLFRLRAVDERDLLADLPEALPFSSRRPDDGKILESEDVSALFGLDIEDTADAIAANGPASADPDVAASIAEPLPVPNAIPAGRPSEPCGTGATEAGTTYHAPTKRRAKARGAKRTRTRKPPKRNTELTPDGFVKWWE